MLTINFGSLPNEIYDPPTYFLNQYEDEWITTNLSKEIILDVDKSTVLSAHVIESPVLGAITPREISGGTQTLILMAYDQSGNVFNASACGDNCAKWILKIAESKDLTITLHHIMDFGNFTCPIRIQNSQETIASSNEYLLEALKYIH